MKKDIHPTYFNKAQMKCACGASLTTGSTMEEVNVEICSQCHPFYTGTEKVLDSAGRVEKFKARRSKASESSSAKKEKPKKERKSSSIEA